MLAIDTAIVKLLDLVRKQSMFLANAIQVAAVGRAKNPSSLRALSIAVAAVHTNTSKNMGISRRYSITPFGVRTE
jgi:hypothetical protein